MGARAHRQLEHSYDAFNFRKSPLGRFLQHTQFHVCSQGLHDTATTFKFDNHYHWHPVHRLLPWWRPGDRTSESPATQLATTILCVSELKTEEGCLWFSCHLHSLTANNDTRKELPNHSMWNSQICFWRVQSISISFVMLCYTYADDLRTELPSFHIDQRTKLLINEKWQHGTKKKVERKYMRLNAQDLYPNTYTR